MGGAIKRVVDPILDVAKPIAQIAGPVVGGVMNGVDEAEARRNAANTARETKERMDDAAYRREATYRSTRAGLQGAIEDFYKQKGWTLPDKSLPGYGTARGLPGEKSLYGDTSIAGEAPSEENSEEEISGPVDQRGMSGSEAIRSGAAGRAGEDDEEAGGVGPAPTGLDVAMQPTRDAAMIGIAGISPDKLRGAADIPGMNPKGGFKIAPEIMARAAKRGRY